MPEIAVFDVETTGLSPTKGHRVIEIGFVILDEDLRVKRYFESLINPKTPIRNVHNHGIRESDVYQAPTFKELLPRLVGELKDVSCLVGHNLVQMDFPFLEAEMKICGYLLPELKKICTLNLARKIKPGAENNKLASLAQHFGIGFPAEQHRALSDALVTAELLRCFSHSLEVSIPPNPLWPAADGEHHDFVIRNGSELDLRVVSATALERLAKEGRTKSEDVAGDTCNTTWKPSSEQTDSILNRLFHMAFDPDSDIAEKGASTLKSKAQRNPDRFECYVVTLALLAQQKNKDVKYNAFYALGNLPFESSTTSLATLIPKLSDKYLRSGEFHTYAELIFEGVGLIATNERAEILCNIVCNRKRDALVRAYAGAVLGSHFDDDALSFMCDDLVDAAMELTEHPTKEVRNVAADLLNIL